VDRAHCAMVEPPGDEVGVYRKFRRVPPGVGFYHRQHGYKSG